MQNQRSELSVREKEIKRQKSIKPPKSSENSFKLQNSPTTENQTPSNSKFTNNLKICTKVIKEVQNLPKHNYRNIPKQVQRHE